MEINNVTAGQSSNPVYIGAKKAEITKDAAPKAENSSKDKILLPEKQVKDVHRTEQQRLDTVVQAASQFKNVYAVSDTTFTIFKDSTGQFVTRFTSLKDGSVTYVPEPDIARFIETNKARQALVEIQA